MTWPINAKACILFPKFALLSLSLQVDSGDGSGFQSQHTNRSSDYCLQPRVFYFLPPELDLCFFVVVALVPWVPVHQKSCVLSAFILNLSGCGTQAD